MVQLNSELRKLLQQVTANVDQIREHLNDECARHAEAWAAYLTEYIYSSAEAVEALANGDGKAAAKHRLDAACHRARADRKHKDLRRAIERLPNEPSA
jgi:hypothetical protein